MFLEQCTRFRAKIWFIHFVNLTHMDSLDRFIPLRTVQSFSFVRFGQLKVKVNCKWSFGIKIFTCPIFTGQ